MKNISKIPTFLGLIVLVAGIIAGIVLIQNRALFRLGAEPEAAPKDVRITNITGSSFTVTWVTEKEVSGFVKWGTSETSQGRVEQDQAGKQSFTHTATVGSLSPERTYFLKINSGGIDYDNNAVAWQVKLGPDLGTITDTNLISGTVIKANGQPAEGALVYIVAGGGSPLSTITSESGSYLVSIGSARSQDLNSYVAVDNTNTLLEISVNAGQAVASAQVYPISAKPAPPIILGQVHDFRNLEAGGEGEAPKASLTLPEESSPSSGFGVEEGSATQAQTITLDSIETNEVITTEEPEFFGEGPAGTTITITLESEVQTTSIKIPASGDWKWNPTTELSAGTHKITITWRDSNGILRTLSRTFIVSASEGPAFEATPSATPSLSPSPTPKVSPSPSPKISPSPTTSATPSAVPVSGSLTPTIILFIMGIGVLTLAILIWKKANA